MKWTMAVLAVLTVVVGVVGWAQAKDLTQYVAAKDNFNDTLAPGANFGGGGTSGYKRFAKAHQETTFYADWTPANKTAIAAALAAAAPLGETYLLRFQAATGESPAGAGVAGEGAEYFKPFIGVFFSLNDWSKTMATDTYADFDVFNGVPVPWLRESDGATVSFWNLTGDIANSTRVVGGWQTGSAPNAASISWNKALLDPAVVTALLTNPNARGLRALSGDEYYNDQAMGSGKWGGIATARLVVVEAYQGDADLNDVVEFADYQKLEVAFGKTVGANWAEGDFDRDGDVDFADYQLLEVNFGKVLVPEPATIGLLALGIGGLISMRKKRGLMSVLLALVVLGGMAASSQASVVNLTITSPSAGAWQAWASVSSDTGGLSSFIINVTADNGLAIATSLNKSPKSIDVDFNPVGFTTLRYNYFPNTPGTPGIGIQAGQPITSGIGILEGIGITAGSYTGGGPTVTWTAPVLLASGTYTGSTGALHVRLGNGGVNVLNGSNGVWSGGVVAATTVNGGDLLIPEPATMLLVLGGLAGMIVRRRR